MSTQTLTSIATTVVDQYNQAGKQLVRAYRRGSERAVGAVSERFAATVNAGTLPLVTDGVKAGLIGAQQRVAGAVSFGVEIGANGADLTIDQVARRVTSGIERVSGATSRVDGLLGTPALERVGSLALPVANVSLEIANAVAEGSKRLSDRVAGSVAVPAKKAARKAVKKVARKPAAKRAQRGTRRA